MDCAYEFQSIHEVFKLGLVSFPLNLIPLELMIIILTHFNRKKQPIFSVLVLCCCKRTDFFH